MAEEPYTTQQIADLAHVARMKTRDEIRTAFWRRCEDRFDVRSIEQMKKKMTIAQIRITLSKVQLDLPHTNRQQIALAMKEVYRIAGGRVSTSGNVRFDF